MASYSYATLQQVCQEISNRLYDPNQVFWSYNELVMYVQESLRTFNAYAQYWRGDFLFDTSSIAQGYGDGGYGTGGYGGDAGTTVTTWYDLTQVPNTLRPYTQTDFNLFTIIQYHLLEPPTGATWTGTPMFNMDDLSNSLQRRWNEILSVTGCTISWSMQNAQPTSPRNPLSQNVLDVRRIAWFPTPLPGPGGQGYGDGGYGDQPYGGVSSQPDTYSVPNVMWQEDIWTFQNFEYGYTTFPQGIPFTYAISTNPILSFDTDVVPQQEGQYELLTVNAAEYAFNPNMASPINIPTDFVWVLKWGILADLLSKESEAKDLMRAEYCNTRYKQGLKLLQESAAVLQFRIDNVPLWVDSVKNADEYQTLWESAQTGKPQAVFTAGLNFIALNPAPDDNPFDDYQATVTVVQNAPIPMLPGDFIQIGQDEYDVIVDYAQHLALFKNGGWEFSRTRGLYERFVRQAAIYNSKLAEMGEFKEEIYGLSQREEVTNPRLTKNVSMAVNE